MRIILAVVRADLVDTVSNALIQNDYHVTQIASAGGFLRRGNTTLVCGVADEDIDDALQVIRSVCNPNPEATEHCVTLFVLHASQFVQI